MIKPMKSTSGKQLNKLKRVLINLEKMQKSLEPNTESMKLNSVSLKILTTQLQTAFSPQPRTERVQRKKNRVYQKPCKNNSIEEAKIILEDREPKKKKFITEKLMQTQSMFNLLNQRKRQFGFTSDYTQAADNDFTAYSIYHNALGSKNVSKRLNAILYNNTFRNSQRCKRNHLWKRFDLKSEDARDVRSERVSPLLNLIDEKRERYADKNQIAIDFRNVVTKADLENGLMKLKISKFMFTKTAFVDN